MIKQLIFSGNVSQNESIIIDPASIDRIYTVCKNLGITGIKIYTDGGYFFIAEGTPDAVQTIKERYAEHEKLANLIVLLENTVEHPEFEDFKICCRESDAHADIPQCFTLDERGLDIFLTSKASKMTKILTNTFARVNNLVQ